MSAATFAAILSGAANPATAYLEGHIRIAGDKALVRALRFLV